MGIQGKKLGVPQELDGSRYELEASSFKIREACLRGPS